MVSKMALAGGALRLTEAAFDKIKTILKDELCAVLRKAIIFVGCVRGNVVTLKIVKVSLPFSFDFQELSEKTCDYPKEKMNTLNGRKKQAEYYFN